jgi:type II secretion system protein N
MAADDVAISGGLGGLRITGLTLAAVALTAFFMVLGFPYDRLAERLAYSIEARTGSRIALGPVSLGFVRWAPGLEAEGVQIVQPDGTRIDLDHLGLRPALSRSWLRGNPALATDLRSARGDASGVATLGDARGFEGRVTTLDLELLPQKHAAPLLVKGIADADVDVTFGPEGPEGSVVFEARDGLVTHPELPLPMPFQKLVGELELGGPEWVRIRDIALESPLAKGHARGTIGRAARFAAAPLRLEIELEVSGAIQGSLNAQGVAVGEAGQIRMDVSGTPGRPVVR